ncbi:hypothetical protein A1Q1_02892 [Trichosporon asahii var. asahii CBS 2479]|uniref:Uncharacterized protein n=1 Tax=Trichosporon asahii var. asahii (strain ATCC 90039 / CBS 2479 / JCM 2466 / KCTC 7840 / NBRC 103889/ NCYC 2677 / UAMH 7654) TaxID=1186058 RepID=J5QMX4_TRIAS|nr:hypothetical protein A1Q1_02892 [Trichosporon asahii var. asahii CBS 2479]EJT48188.1 hypothetical protein A1Q1_02892 [Trichosporon asahii var. asahii CBS 2479]
MPLIPRDFGPMTEEQIAARMRPIKEFALGCIMSMIIIDTFLCAVFLMQSHRYWMVHSSDRWWIKMIVIAITFLGLFTTADTQFVAGFGTYSPIGGPPTYLADPSDPHVVRVEHARRPHHHDCDSLRPHHEPAKLTSDHHAPHAPHARESAASPHPGRDVHGRVPDRPGQSVLQHAHGDPEQALHRGAVLLAECARHIRNPQRHHGLYGQCELAPSSKADKQHYPEQQSKAGPATVHVDVETETYETRVELPRPGLNRMQSAMGRQQHHALEKIEHSDEDEGESDTAVLRSDCGSNVKLTPPTPSDGSPPNTPGALAPHGYRTAPAQSEYNDDKGAGVA